jgi:RNA 3'-terminal phosphate cyclase (ATP)
VIHIDGSAGGGQLLRTSLCLSLVTGRPFLITKIRASRPRDGLMAQHLCCVRAAQRVGGAFVQGDSKRSTQLQFEPSGLFPGHLELEVGTAGSTTLVLQTVLPALMCADGESRVRVTGGTHNPWAPPWRFFEVAYGGLLRDHGADLSLELIRPGFFPTGGGEVQARIGPGRLRELDLREAGKRRPTRAWSVVAGLDPDIGERELRTLRKNEVELRGAEVDHWPEAGPGNALEVELASKHLTEVVTELGEQGRPAEEVARRCARGVHRHLRGSAPVGEHLADQLLLPMALGAGGVFRTNWISDHTKTNARVIRAFLDVGISWERLGKQLFEVRVEVPGP